MAVVKGKSGRQKKLEKVIGEVELETIAELTLKRVPQFEIAKRLGVSQPTIVYHLEKTIRPRWKERMSRTIDDDAAAVDLLEKVAWERFHVSMEAERRKLVKHEGVEVVDPKSRKRKVQAIIAAKAEMSAMLVRHGLEMSLVERVLTKVTQVGDAGWLQIIQWCIDWRSKVRGDYKRDDSAGGAPAVPVVEIIIREREQVVAFEELGNRLIPTGPSN